MSDEPQGFDPYDAVIADLRAKRDQIDQTIQSLELLRGGGAAPGAAARPMPSQNVAAEGPGAFLGMSIPEAVKKLLAARKRALGNAEIVASLTAGGLALGSKDPVNTVGSVLGRRFDTVGDIVRVSRGTWGLAEWYPNRSFKKKGAVPKGENGVAAPDTEIEDGAAAMSETSEPGQPSEPTDDDLVG